MRLAEKPNGESIHIVQPISEMLLQLFMSSSFLLGGGGGGVRRQESFSQAVQYEQSFKTGA